MGAFGNILKINHSPPVLPAVPLDEVSIPEILEFIAYWESLKADAFAPSWKDFDLAAIDPASLPYVVVADVQREPLNFKIRFWGTGHVTRKGADKTGKFLNEAPDFRGQTAFDEYCWVMNEKEPLASQDLVNLQEFGGMLPFEQILVRLPLSDDGETVNHIVTLAVWDKV